MGISLTKGGNISLSKEAGTTGLRRITVGLGWDARAFTGADFDLDAAAFLLGLDGKAHSTSDIVLSIRSEAPAAPSSTRVITARVTPRATMNRSGWTSRRSRVISNASRSR